MLLMHMLLTSVMVAIVVSSMRSVPAMFVVLMAFLTLYQAVNLLRVYQQRLQADHLRRVAQRTAIWLLGVQLLVMIVGVVWQAHDVPVYGFWLAVVSAQLVLAVIGFRAVQRHWRLMHRQREFKRVSDRDLPSITVAVAARNETEELEECITALLASNYPKLEILVLDDCSQSRRTSEIIRSFAQAGVRFIAGTQPRTSWLAKNQAYATLAEAANGEYIVFCGVDIRVQPDSIRQFVAYAMTMQKSMLCVMPLTVGEKHPSIIQPMRYMWELALPRRTFGSPPVLSSCWLIAKSALKAAGGFQAARNMIVPEAHFAAWLRHGDGYGFLSGASAFGVTSVKSHSRQRDTAVRVLYPQLHRRPEMVVLLSLSIMSLVVLPPALVIAAFVAPAYAALAVIGLLSWGLLYAAYLMVLSLSYAPFSLLQWLSLPVAALVYAGLANYSMYRYEFSDVMWRGRNVCLPVMRTVSKLPPV